MTSSSNNSGGGGIGLFGLLGLLFIGLKLTGNIAWSWWWVLAPFWIPVAFIAGLFLIVIIMFGVVKLWDLVTKSKEERRRRDAIARARANLDRLSRR